MSTHTAPSTKNIITAAFLVAGTCIGAGMLALPVTAAPCGLMPSLSLMAIVYVMMTVTALCLIEIGAMMQKHDSHIISMASMFLGRTGKGVVWILFLFISYASLIAYTAECGSLLSQALSYLFKTSISKTTGCLIFSAIFGPFILGPRHLLGKTNDLLFILLVASYIFFIVVGVGAVQPALLSRSQWSFAYLAIPLVITSFSFQTMVPSLHSFLANHKKALRTAIVLGTSIAFLVYALWLFVIFGSVPFEGAFGLKDALSKGVPATYCLSAITHSTLLPYCAASFALFALTTSYFGLGIGLFDFLSDGLHIPKKGMGRILLGLLVIIPSLIFAISYERIFIVALDISGGFGDTLLNGVIPLTMLFLAAKYFKTKIPPYPLLRKPILYGVFCLFVLAFAVEAYVRYEESHQVVTKQAE